MKSYDIRVMPRKQFTATLADTLKKIQSKSGEDSSYALLLIDIDRFNYMNLALGSELGDVLLELVAGRIQSLFEDDVLFRVGDDEFLVMVSTKRTSDLQELLQSVQGLFLQPFWLRGVQYFINASIGVCRVEGGEQKFELMLQQAGMALRDAKSRGKNRWSVYDPAVPNHAQERLELETDLRRAIQNDQLTLHYQPRLELASGKVICLEALVRWNHPVKGLISPNEFIPLAEESGLIVPLGNWVLRKACLQRKAWMESGLIDTQIAVNISPVQFQDENFADTVIAIIESTGLLPSALELEITESSIMHDIDKTVEILSKLCDKGLTISIDDFGIGYSSLSFIKHFPVQCLKIDRSFVKNILTNRNDLAITNAIINLGHSLNMQIVAEGVEEESQLEVLKKTKCTTIQGYLLSPPISVEDLQQMFVEKELVC